MNVEMSRTLDAIHVLGITAAAPSYCVPYRVCGGLNRKVQCQSWVFHARREISIRNTQEYGENEKAIGVLLIMELEMDPSWTAEFGLSVIYLKCVQDFQ